MTEARELSPEELQRLGPDRLLVRVQSIAYLAENVNAYEVVSPCGADLPAFAAGSHIDVFFRDGRIRQYSLCNNPRERRRYEFAVQREISGRGGSKAIFERVHVGRILAISRPRNYFPLDAGGARSLLLAGGIGITPIIAMVRTLLDEGRPFRLYYCTRSRDRTAFFEEIEALAARGLAWLYHDQGDPARGLDIAGLLRQHEAGTHLYYCGPQGFMRAVAQASSDWPQGAVHFEHFSPPDAVAAGGTARISSGGLSDRDVEAEVSVEFQVKLARLGRTLDVPDDKSIVQVLRENGVEVATSCESGLCGTCRTRYLEGLPDHRDYILNDEERRSDILICCSRAKSPLLVLDL